jgi:pilus assembly protein Flp/PilA
MTLTAAQGANLTLRRDLVGSWTVEMRNLLVRFLKDDAGATAIEYGLIAAGISVAIIAVVSGLGSKLNGKFDSISTQLK